MWKKFVVVMDSNTVLHWSTMKDPGGTIWRWLDFTQEFNFTVTHRAGKHNLNADLISNARHLSEPTKANKGTITQNVYRLPWLSGDIHPAPEDYTPPSCTPWFNCCGILQVIMAWNAVARP